jgi:hypothetical protein
MMRTSARTPRPLRPYGRRPAAWAAACVLATAGLTGGAVLAGAVPAGAQADPACPAPAISGSTATVTCAFTGAAQSWTAPAGVSTATVTLDGGQGGNAPNSQFSPQQPGGKGATVVATIPVTAGDTYQVLAGGAAPGNGSEFGGFNGGGGANEVGGVPFIAGGGASDIALAGGELLVAGGGGGGGLEDGGLEDGGLGVGAPFGAEGVADLA